MEAAGWPRREPQSPAGPRTDGRRRWARPRYGLRPRLPPACRSTCRCRERSRPRHGEGSSAVTLRWSWYAKPSRRRRQGARRGVLLAGDAGIGKTSLAALVAEEAHMRGTAVLYGRCDEDLPVPYRPFAEALGHLVQHAPARAARGTGPPPRRRADSHGPPAREAPGHRRGRARRNAGRPLHAVLGRRVAAVEASARAPLMIVLDDLHWADAQTIPAAQIPPDRGRRDVGADRGDVPNRGGGPRPSAAGAASQIS